MYITECTVAVLAVVACVFLARDLTAVPDFYTYYYYITDLLSATRAIRPSINAYYQKLRTILLIHHKIHLIIYNLNIIYTNYV